MTAALRSGAAALALALTLGVAGCGTPGAPMPPSLNLPAPVQDLTATRAGSQITLTWTMPRRTTDKVVLKDPLAARICYQESATSCIDAASSASFAPGSAATFTGPLPTVLASGTPRVVRFFVDLRNHANRSAGLSNAAFVAAGAPPAPVENLTAELRKSGIVLHWQQNGVNAPLRLTRALVASSAPKPNDPMAPPPEPAQFALLVNDVSQARALDTQVRYGSTYSYRAQRVVRMPAGGTFVELASGLSAPVQIEMRDIFPPSAPAGLAAVASIDAQGQPSIDLSWQPNPESDLAGYIVYRCEADGGWQRVSPATPVVGPGFHDVTVQTGHSYRYAVTAIDTGGHESERSAEATETVPQP